MSSDIVDLDVFVGEPRKVRLAGQTYLFPRDIPAELYLEIHELQRGDEIDDAALIAKVHDDVLELLQVHQPETTRLPAAMSLPVLIRAIGAIYGSKADEPEDADADPTPPKASGGKSPSPKSRSRSSSS